MKKNSLFVLLFAASILCLNSCKDKCYFEKAANPSFATLSDYIGMDITTVKADFESKGYQLNDWQGVTSATIYADEYAEVYRFNTANSAIIGAEYNYRQSGATNDVIKEAFMTMLEDEKTNPNQSGLAQYDGGYEPEDEGDNVTYKTKDEFISAMEKLNFKKIYKAWSRSTYADGKKSVVRVEDGWLFYSVGDIKEED